MNYDELVNALRKRAHDLPERFSKNEFNIKLFLEAADAIKELTDNNVGKWIPVTERLPDKNGAYLVWILWPYEEEPWYSIVNYDADVEAFGEWEEHYHPISLGYLDSEFVEIKNVIAWMPLPEPPEAEEGE